MAVYVIREDYEAWVRSAARARSGECDYGCWWTLDQDFPRWRVSVVKKTGEAYAVELSPGRPSRFILLGTVSPGEKAYGEMNAIMGDWANPDGPLHNNLHALIERWG